MKIFDFGINTYSVNEQEFNGAIDFLRYFDCRSRYNTFGFDSDNIPPSFSEEPISVDEFKKFIESVYVFIEKCNEFYPPDSNFNFPYRNFDMKDGIRRYFDVYLLLSFLKTQNSVLLSFNKEESQIYKNLSSFINISQFIRAFISSYNSVMRFSGKYNEFGLKLIEAFFNIELFPFKKCVFKHNGKEIEFICSEYVLKDGDMYVLSKTTFDESDVKLFFAESNADKTKFNELIYLSEKGFSASSEKTESLDKLKNEKIALKNRRRDLKKQIYKIYNAFDRKADKKMKNPIFVHFLYDLQLKKVNESVRPLKDELKKMSKNLDRLSYKIKKIEDEIYKLSFIEEWMELVLENNEIISYRKIL